MSILPNELIFLWAAAGSPDTPPTRLEVTICPRCAALVPTVNTDQHRDWHRFLVGHLHHHRPPASSAKSGVTR